MTLARSGHVLVRSTLRHETLVDHTLVPEDSDADVPTSTGTRLSGCPRW